ncbi:hypothetical protein SUGI_0073200 [Cryptomeria japonica]|nr:hypothetical protein SUGI_0073200 [Cryptomeria japonica]
MDGRERKRNKKISGSGYLRMQFGDIGGGSEETKVDVWRSKNVIQAKEENEMAQCHVREHHHVFTLFTFIHCDMF